MITLNLRKLFGTILDTLTKWNEPDFMKEQTKSVKPTYKVEPNVGLNIVTPPTRGKLKIKKKKES